MTLPHTKTMPTIPELVARALADSDFVVETPRGTSQRELYRAATIATNQAAEAWEEANGLPIGATVPDLIRHPVSIRLVGLAQDRHDAEMEAIAYALLDGIEAGDLDEDGSPVAYDRCWSAA
jgi:hypothetical protein